MTKQSKIILYGSTALWSVIMLIISTLMFYEVSINIHFSYNILLEFTKAIALWYILCIAVTLIYELDKRKRR